MSRKRAGLLAAGMLLSFFVLTAGLCGERSRIATVSGPSGGGLLDKIQPINITISFTNGGSTVVFAYWCGLYEDHTVSCETPAGGAGFTGVQSIY